MVPNLYSARIIRRSELKINLENADLENNLIGKDLVESIYSNKTNTRNTELIQ